MLVVDSPDVIRRQAVPWGPKATVAVAIVAGMVVLLAFGIVPPAIAGLMAATAMVVTRVVSVRRPTGPSRGRPSSSSAASSR